MRIALAAAVLVAAACGQSSGGPDAAPLPLDATEVVCDSGGGEPFDLSVGYLAGDSAFVELADGDDTILVLGPQGIYMLRIESRALLSFTEEQVCFTCRILVGPSETGFAGAELDGPIGFTQVEAGTFGGTSNVLLGSRETSDAFADAEVDVAMDCDGNGLSGSVARTVVLRLPPS